MNNFRLWFEEQDAEETALIARFDREYPKAGGTVDGRQVLPNVPNMSSIGSSLEDYYILPVVRKFPIHGFGGKNSYYAANDQKRVMDLVAAIAQSKKISPIIIAEEKGGPYVLEGGHRISALVELKAVSIPAVIVLDLNSLLG